MFLGVAERRAARRAYIAEVRRARAFVLAGKVSFAGAAVFVASSWAAMIIAFKKF